MELAGAQAENVVFRNGVGTLTLDDPAAYTGQIVAESIGQTGASTFNLVLDGIADSSVTSYVYTPDGDHGVLAIDTTSGDYNLNFVGELQTSDFTLSAEPQSLSTLPPALDVAVTPRQDPTISGIAASETITDRQTATPFAGVTITELSSGATGIRSR